MLSEKTTYTFIVNPVSGRKGKRALLAAIPRFLPAGTPYETLTTQRPGHATDLARETSADVVVAVGGDGTVSEVAKGLLGSRQALGILPCGSGDGLALHLGQSRRPRRAVRNLAEGTVQEMDAARMDGTPFFCTAGVGLDAIVAWKFARSPRRGLGTYIAKAWETWKTYRGEDFEIEVDGTSVRTRAVIVTVGNANQWGNQARITPLASVCDGQLDVTVVLPFRTVEIPFLAARLLLGKAAGSRRVRCLRGRRIRIRRAEEGPAHRDGDPCTMGREILFEAVPAALRVVVPAHRTGKI